MRFKIPFDYTYGRTFSVGEAVKIQLSDGGDGGTIESVEAKCENIIAFVGNLVHELHARGVISDGIVIAMLTKFQEVEDDDRKEPVRP